MRSGSRKSSSGQYRATRPALRRRAGARRRPPQRCVEKRGAIGGIDGRQREEDHLGRRQRHGCRPAGGLPIGPERAVQPGPREHPFVLDRRRRQIERGGRFLDAQAGEVAQRDDLRFPRVGLLEPRQGFVDRDEIGRATDRRA